MIRTRAILASIAALGALLSGCGPGTGAASKADPSLHGTGLRRPLPSSAAGMARAIAARWAAATTSAPNTPIEWQTIGYTATVFNPGSPEGFTAFITTRRTVRVTPDSAATIDTSNGAPARFATAADKARWKAAGRPTLGQASAASQARTVPAGQFSFLPQGSNLTYSQAASLPARPRRLAATILDRLRAYAGSHPPASLELKQLAYLIATAPLTDAARSAAWQVLATLPGLRTCQIQSDPARPSTIDLCISSAADEILVSLDFSTGVILAIVDRLLLPSPSYPDVPARTIIESSEFPAT